MTRTMIRFLAVSALLVLVAAGCQMKAPLPPPTPAPAPELTLAERAENAWRAGDMVASETLYSRLIEEGALSREALATAWERYVFSALANGHQHAALQSMDAFRAAAPGGAEYEPWQEAYRRALQGVGDTGAKQQHATRIVEDASLPPLLRARAGAILAGYYWRTADLQAALGVLQDLAAEFPARGKDFQAALERGLFDEVASVDESNLDAMGFLIPPTEQDEFPYTIIELERARRLAQTPGGMMQARQIVARIKPLLADASLADRVFMVEAPDFAGIDGLALALPLSGPFKSIGWKIMQGANLAQAELASMGYDVAVEGLNTDSADWVQKVRELPSNYRIVGGPLRLSEVSQLQDSGLLQSRAFFTFLNSTGELSEGYDAWRFFSSPQDQVLSLIDFATGRYGVRQVAVLYPDEPFGRRMGELFSEEARNRGIEITAMRTYPPKDQSGWYDIVGQLAATASFDAVFLPGDWEHAKMLVPNFLYHKRGDALVLGPALWAQTLSRQSYVVENDFRRTVFPGAWWPGNATPAARSLTTLAAQRDVDVDFWVALGFDFVRFANAFGTLPEAWTAQDVNARLQEAAQVINWAEAPITWGPQGVAQQDLFLFRPTMQGFTLYNEMPGAVPETEERAFGPRTRDPGPILP
ncbi:hypothetical protein DPQ33_04060 [Oceanidesulfovibrio indonesiensis]|uniref:Leucine-binding protein domain-containing protein n=2 Tax=Oceanidesulfovibrio indonesiensis TaxID=54767 RepID=A0A7M3MHJ5_9BACT|nr:hypothetical protein DPQ33_04060 [Oceanidesulfovibrio indonesiensis]